MKHSWKLWLSGLGLFLLCTGCKTTQSAIGGMSTSQPSSQPSMMQTGIRGAGEMIKLLSSKDETTRSKAKSNLLALGAKAVPALIGALRGTGKRTKIGALDVLGKMGAKAASAKDAVQNLTKSSDKEVASAASTTMKKIQ